jgi:hypothetical protein
LDRAIQRFRRFRLNASRSNRLRNFVAGCFGFLDLRPSWLAFRGLMRQLSLVSQRFFMAGGRNMGAASRRSAQQLRQADQVVGRGA